MKINKPYGSKERLFEMMNGVNKGLLKEDFDYHAAEMDHLNDQDLEDELKAQMGKDSTPPQPPQSEPPLQKEGNEKDNFDSSSLREVRELYTLLTVDGIEDIREYYPDWVVDELSMHDYIEEDTVNGTYQWRLTADGKARFPNAESLMKFLISAAGGSLSSDQGEAPYLRGYEP